MKKIIALVLLLCAATTLCPAVSAVEELDIYLTLTKGERSKDSHSTKKTISLKGREINYDVTYHGRSGGKREPVHKVFQITDGELGKLRELIRQKDLLNSGKKDFPATGGYTYFDIALRIKMDDKESSINLTGNPRNTEIKTDTQHQNVEALLKEIYGIIRRQDTSIKYQGMIE